MLHFKTTKKSAVLILRQLYQRDSCWQSLFLPTHPEISVASPRVDVTACFFFAGRGVKPCFPPCVRAGWHWSEPQQEEGTGWVSSEAPVRPAGPAVLSGAGTQAGIGRGRAKEQRGNGHTVRGTERRESKAVKNKELDEEKAEASAAQPSQPDLHMGTCFFFFFFFCIMATSDVSSLIPMPFSRRVLPD